MRVATLTRPRALNSLTPPMLEGLHGLWQGLSLADIARLLSIAL